jgi:hypothetical protein
VKSEIVKRYLVHKPDLLTDEAKASVRTLEVGKDLKWEGASLKLAFEGNRVTCWPGRGRRRHGEDPHRRQEASGVPECIAFTRTSPEPVGMGTGAAAVSSEQAAAGRGLGPQGDRVDEKAERIKFTVTGSKTGADGDGVSAERFVSTSGRVVIEPGDWWVKNIQQMTKAKVPVGFEIKWKAIPMFSDTFAAPRVDDDSRSIPSPWPRDSRTGSTAGGRRLRRRPGRSRPRPPVAAP